MKQITFFVFTLFCLTQCKNEKSKTQFVENIYKFIDTISIVDSDSYYDYKLALSKRTSSYLETYITDSIKAVVDIKNNHLVYPYSQFDYLMSFDQFSKTLKEKYNIYTIEDYRGCLVDDSTQYAFAYERLLKAEIANRRGNNFIQNLIIESDSIYYYTNKDSLYDLTNAYAALKYYQSDSYKKFENELVRKAKKNLKHPKGYKFKKEQGFSYTSVDFILKKNGSISNLSVESIFQNTENEKYRNFFEKQVKNFFINKTLIPIEVYGLKINTKQSITIYHK